jgi:hypothetical protein
MGEQELFCSWTSTTENKFTATQELDILAEHSGLILVHNDKKKRKI